MRQLNRIENERKITLPEIYKRFYDQCSYTIPENLIGTELWSYKEPDLYVAATELLEEDGVENFLEADDFVFMMHQGYIFWYFKANGDADPIVYSYHEEKMKPDNLGNLSDFLKEYNV
jgi:hypothetical protein